MIAEALSWLNPWNEARMLREELDLVRSHAMAQAEQNVATVNKLINKLMAAQEALRRVANEERPTSNATVKRMAKIAREGLK